MHPDDWLVAIAFALVAFGLLGLAMVLPVVFYPPI